MNNQNWDEVAARALDKLPVDKFYDDAMAPPAKRLGAGLADLIAVIFLPAQFLNTSGQFKLDEFKMKLEDRAKRIPDERRQAPPLHISAPAVQAMIFTEDAPELRELYLGLLTTAMDSSTVRLAHPAFTEIIRNISPDEARILGQIGRRSALPAVCVRAYFPYTVDPHVPTSLNPYGDKGPYETILGSFSGIAYEANCVYPELEDLYVGNLMRLGLLSLRTGESLTDAKSYEKLGEATEVRIALGAAINRPGGRPEVVPVLIAVTELAHRFYDACISQK